MEKAFLASLRTGHSCSTALRRYHDGEQWRARFGIRRAHGERDIRSVAAELARRSLGRRYSSIRLLPTPENSTTLGSAHLHSVVNGKLEARMGAAWSAVEVYDNTKNQLRVEVFGSGSVVTVEMAGGHAIGLTMDGATFKRVP